jgi:hypothetical protein
MTIVTGGPARQRDKIIAIVLDLAKAGDLRPWHRDCEVRARAEARLKELGCPRHERPSLTTWKRELPKLRELWRSSS